MARNFLQLGNGRGNCQLCGNKIKKGIPQISHRAYQSSASFHANAKDCFPRSKLYIKKNGCPHCGVVDKDGVRKSRWGDSYECTHCYKKVDNPIESEESFEAQGKPTWAGYCPFCQKWRSNEMSKKDGKFTICAKRVPAPHTNAGEWDWFNRENFARKGGKWTKPKDNICGVILESKPTYLDSKNAEVLNMEEPMIEEPDFIPNGDGRAIGQQNSAINLTPLHAEESWGFVVVNGDGVRTDAFRTKRQAQFYAQKLRDEAGLKGVRVVKAKKSDDRMNKAQMEMIFDAESENLSECCGESMSQRTAPICSACGKVDYYIGLDGGGYGKFTASECCGKPHERKAVLTCDKCNKIDYGAESHDYGTQWVMDDSFERYPKWKQEEILNCKHDWHIEHTASGSSSRNCLKCGVPTFDKKEMNAESFNAEMMDCIHCKIEGKENPMFDYDLGGVYDCLGCGDTMCQEHYESDSHRECEGFNAESKRPQGMTSTKFRHKETGEIATRIPISEMRKWEKMNAESFNAFSIDEDDEGKIHIENKCDGCGKEFLFTQNSNIVGGNRAGAIVYENLGNGEIYEPTYSPYDDLLCKSCYKEEAKEDDFQRYNRGQGQLTYDAESFNAENVKCECGTRIGTDEEIYMKSVPFEVIDNEDGWKVVCMNCAKSAQSFNAESATYSMGGEVGFEELEEPEVKAVMKKHGIKIVDREAIERVEWGGIMGHGDIDYIYFQSKSLAGMEALDSLIFDGDMKNEGDIKIVKNAESFSAELSTNEPLYIKNSSIFDNPERKYDIPLYTKILKEAGATKVWTEPLYGWANQSEVVIFTGLGEHEAEKALKQGVSFLTDKDPTYKMWFPLIHSKDAHWDAESFNAEHNHWHNKQNGQFYGKWSKHKKDGQFSTHNAETLSEIEGPTAEATTGGLHSPSSFDITWEDLQGLSSPSMPPNEIHFSESKKSSSIKALGIASIVGLSVWKGIEYLTAKKSLKQSAEEKRKGTACGSCKSQGTMRKGQTQIKNSEYSVGQVNPVEAEGQEDVMGAEGVTNPRHTPSPTPSGYPIRSLKMW